MRETMPALAEYRAWTAGAPAVIWDTPEALMASVEPLEGAISDMRALHRKHPELAPHLPKEPFADVAAERLGSAWLELRASCEDLECDESGSEGLLRLQQAVADAAAAMDSPELLRALGLREAPQSMRGLVAAAQWTSAQLALVAARLQALEAGLGSATQEVQEAAWTFGAAEPGAEETASARARLLEAASQLEALVTRFGGACEASGAAEEHQGGMWPAVEKALEECRAAVGSCRALAAGCGVLLDLHSSLESKLPEKAQGLLQTVRALSDGAVKLFPCSITNCPCWTCLPTHGVWPSWEGLGPGQVHQSWQGP